MPLPLIYLKVILTVKVSSHLLLNIAIVLLTPTTQHSSSQYFCS